MTSNVKQKISKKCAMTGCPTAYVIGQGKKNKKFYGFPEDPELNQKWKAICGIPPEKEQKCLQICGDHFDSSHFRNFSRTILNKGIVPNSLNAPAKAPALLHEHDYADNVTFVETPLPVTDHNSFVNNQNLVDNGQNLALDMNEYLVKHVDNAGNIAKYTTTTPARGFLTAAGLAGKCMTDSQREMYRMYRRVESNCCKLKARLNRANNKIKQLKNQYDQKLFEIMDQNLNPVCKSFIDSQLRNAVRSSTAKRYTEEDKSFALSLYKLSPRVYRHLSKDFLLPSTRVLKQLKADMAKQCPPSPPLTIIEPEIEFKIEIPSTF